MRDRLVPFRSRVTGAGASGQTRWRGDGEKGAAVVEFALALPLIAALTMGTLEFGMAWRATNAVERVVANAGRTGSSLADYRYADYELLRAVHSGLNGLSDVQIVRVIVWRATNSPTVPAQCLNINATGNGRKGVNNLCNVYSPTQVATTSTGGFGSNSSGGCTSGSWDASWCPRNRIQQRPNPDLIGVYVEARRTNMTGLFGPELTIRRSSVYMLEPPSIGDL